MTTTDRPVRHILLRSSWQTANIGDVAHTPGAIRALRAAAPEARITHWPVELDVREREMYAEHFPGIELVDGTLDADGRPDTPELARAWDDADLLVHGSGASICVPRDMRLWAATGKEYGFFGITVDPFGPMTPSTLTQAGAQIDALPVGYLQPEDKELLDGASFVLCRDGLSLRYLRQQQVRARVLAFGPDATFAYDVRDDDSADAMLDRLRLSEGEFLVAVPRLRYGPYPRRGGPNRLDHLRAALSGAHAPHDLGVLADAITDWVRGSGRQVLIAPEMRYAVALAAEYFPRTLPADVRDHVRVLDHYWDLPTATAVIGRAAGVLSMECHSPIFAATVGTPAVYLRQPSETIKGAMYRDLSPEEMVVEIEASDAARRLAARLTRFHQDQDAARDGARTLHRSASTALHAAGRVALGLREVVS
jgi:hypothetical protein